jgi:hypothetical protein
MYGGEIATWTEFKHLVGKVHGFKSSTRLVAILFMRQGQEITDKSIVPSLKYFDLRSGQDLHFILPGWSFHEPGRGRESVDKEWVYSDEQFIRACDVIASETNWKYSGGTDLLLLTTRRDSKSHVVINFSGAINIALHVMKDRMLIESPEVLIERIIQFARSYKGVDPLLKLSLQEARVSLFEGVVNTLLSYISKDAKDRFDYAKQFVIRDVSKPSVSSLGLISVVTGNG